MKKKRAGIRIVKSNGLRVPFRPEKIRETLKRIGGKPETIEHVLHKVAAQIKDGMTTGEVFSILRRELKREDRCLGHRYNLRAGLLRLGPAGFKFEKYVASILAAYHYETEIPERELKGLCVDHEIDVIARKRDATIMIEAKFRNRFDDVVNLKDTMATWARYHDLKDAARTGKGPDFTEVWIVTNGRFSESALQFGACKGILMIGWSTQGQSLARMVDHAALYPITVIDDLKAWELDNLASKNLMLCREIADKRPEGLAKRVGMNEDRAKKIVSDCIDIVNFE